MYLENNKNSATNECKITAVLESFGKYHVIQYCLLCLPAVFITMINTNYVFAAGEVNYRCRVPECEDGVWSPSPLWWPPAADRCSRPRLRTNATCAHDNFTDHLEPCTEWIYENNNTVVAELNLACHPWQSNIIGTVHSTGMLISMALSGWMCDRFGRKPTLIITVVASFIGQVKTFSTSYGMYVAVEFLEALISGGSYAAAMILMLEISTPDKRVLCGVMFSYAIYVGEALIAIIAMFVPYWKHLLRIINGPTILFISYIFLIRESPRWQILNSKTEMAKETLSIMANMNKLNINHKQLREMNETELKITFKIDGDSKREGLMDMMKSKVAMKWFLVAVICRFSSSFVYFGLMINSVYLPGDKYTNFILATLMSFPGELIALYLMNKFGRKRPLMAVFVLSGAMCVASGYVPETHRWMKLVIYLTGKMLISAGFTGALTYAMELFPTSIRGTLLGVCACSARLGSTLAPLTPMLNDISEVLPSLIFGGSAVIAGCLLIFTPESKDMPLMDTIQQLEDYNRALEAAVKTGQEHNAGFDLDEKQV